MFSTQSSHIFPSDNRDSVVSPVWGSSAPLPFLCSSDDSLHACFHLFGFSSVLKGMSGTWTLEVKEEGVLMGGCVTALLQPLHSCPQSFLPGRQERHLVLLFADEAVQGHTGAVTCCSILSALRKDSNKSACLSCYSYLTNTESQPSTQRLSRGGGRQMGKHEQGLQDATILGSFPD